MINCFHYKNHFQSLEYFSAKITATIIIPAIKNNIHFYAQELLAFYYALIKCLFPSWTCSNVYSILQSIRSITDPCWITKSFKSLYIADSLLMDWTNWLISLLLLYVSTNATELSSNSSSKKESFIFYFWVSLNSMAKFFDPFS